MGYREQGDACAVKNRDVKNELADRDVCVCSVRPAVNQVEFHPLLWREQQPLVAFCREQVLPFPVLSAVWQLLVSDYNI